MRWLSCSLVESAIARFEAMLAWLPYLAVAIEPPRYVNVDLVIPLRGFQDPVAHARV